MAGVGLIADRPRSVVVVGAGIIGLSTAWFLQDRGVKVTVVDRTGVGAGASWGNAGWIAPALTIPLNSLAVRRNELCMHRASTAMARFSLPPKSKRAGLLTRFVANREGSPWRRAIRANAALSEGCVEAFGALTANGVEVPVTDAPVTAVFRDAVEAKPMLWQLDQLEKAGQAVYATALSGAALREQVPLASPAITTGLNINNQRFVDPRRFIEALGRSVVDRGATMCRLDIGAVGGSAGGVTAHSHRQMRTADAAVIATGARLSRLAGRWLRIPVQAGCGYSFTVPVARPMPNPIYLPGIQVACTPYNGAMRVSGTMEFRGEDDPLTPQRLEAIVASAGPLLDSARWAERSDLWTGAYPIAPDGRPLVGEVSPGIYVAGGHGMWGFTHGPVTGRLLAEQITTGRQPPALADLAPLRQVARWQTPSPQL